ncbi:MAG: hypothetical protein H6673_16235 [Anaerolineales bacterium]|nr:hypothetical protein [Anaerolineales bacterium]
MSKALLVAGMVIALVLVGVVGVVILRPPQALIRDAGFSVDIITPNADGEDDIAVFSYDLARNAKVSLSFEREDGSIYVFRTNEQRSGPQHYSVNFSGVVDGFSLPDDGDLQANIERRLIPDGRYTWTFVAENEDERETETGTLVIMGGDTQLPLINAFDLSSDYFTPNQDGVRDRVTISIYLAKEADLQVYLQDAEGVKYFVSEVELGRNPGEAGNHQFDYDGGVDDGFEPPADGDYTLYAVAQDAVGQRVVRTATFAIQDGGLPQAEIATQVVGSLVCFSVLPWDERYASTRELQGDIIDIPESNCADQTKLVMEQGDLLAFRLTVLNYGDTPIRTAGPFPGAVYSFEQLYNSLGELQKPGTFRVGVHCDTVITDHPWRWGIASPDELVEVFDPQLDDTFYYLEPDEGAVVWGAIRMTEIYDEQNPQNCYASLIHEGVRIVQRAVGSRSVEILPRSLEDTTAEAPAAPVFPIG